MTRSTPAESQVKTLQIAEVLSALSLATDLGAGRPMGHAMRACILGMQMAGELGLPSVQQAELYYSFLLMHSGCSALSLGMAPIFTGNEIAAIGEATLRDGSNMGDMLDWMRQYVAPEAPFPTRALTFIHMLLHMREGEEHLRGACEVAVRVAQRLGMPEGVQEAVRHYQERWDGKGPFGLVGEAIPVNARLLQIALKIEAMYTARGQAEAEAMARGQKGTTFDPQMVEAFFAVARDPSLWETLAQKDPWQVVRALEPDSPYRTISEARLDDVALALADVVDLKSPLTVGHSRETAGIAERIARRMELPASEIVTIRRAGLVHDLGLIALPSKLLRDPDRLSAADQEKIRLHPYYTERILSRIPGFEAVAELAGKHHERLDGSGYYRGLSGSELPTGACIVALADEFQERLNAQPGQVAPEPQDILKELGTEAGTRFSAECFEALAQEYGLAAPPPPPRREWPAGLTDREVEVLQVVATGASNRQIAQALFISEKTVASHLEHIYNKIGISSRAAAVFFAMEHELIA